MVAADAPDEPFASALLLSAALHGLMSLRLHKPDVGWTTSPEADAERLILAMTDPPPTRASPGPHTV